MIDGTVQNARNMHKLSPGRGSPDLDGYIQDLVKHYENVQNGHYERTERVPYVPVGIKIIMEKKYLFS